MDAERRQIITKITDKIMSKRIAAPFSIPIDPDSPNNPGYSDFVKEPMDLQTIKTKIQSNSYNTVEEWDHDMRLVFKNAVDYNGLNTIYGVMADQLKRWYQKYLEKYPILQSQWRDGLDRSIVDLVKILINNKAVKSNLTRLLRDALNGKTSAPADREFTDNQDTHQRKKKKDADFIMVDSAVPQPPPPKVIKPPPKQGMDKDAIYRSINNIYDEANLVRIVSLLQALEPKLNITEDSTVSLNQLSANTLNELTNLLYEISA